MDFRAKVEILEDNSYTTISQGQIPPVINNPVANQTLYRGLYIVDRRESRLWSD